LEFTFRLHRFFHDWCWAHELVQVTQSSRNPKLNRS
jgi:hypothetical protein